MLVFVVGRRPTPAGGQVGPTSRLMSTTAQLRALVTAEARWADRDVPSGGSRRIPGTGYCPG